MEVTSFDISVVMLAKDCAENISRRVVLIPVFLFFMQKKRLLCRIGGQHGCQCLLASLLPQLEHHAESIRTRTLKTSSLPRWEAQLTLLGPENLCRHSQRLSSSMTLCSSQAGNDSLQ